MDITPLIPKGKQVITGYGNGGFSINGQRMEGSLLVLPDRTLPWQVTRTGEIDTGKLVDLLTSPLPEGNRAELLLLGTGASMAAPDTTLANALKAMHIALECMDTGAACRTYNILLAEERRVATALIAVS